jgi:hypothetical protein
MQMEPKRGLHSSRHITFDALLKEAENYRQELLTMGADSESTSDTSSVICPSIRDILTDKTFSFDDQDQLERLTRTLAKEQEPDNDELKQFQRLITKIQKLQRRKSQVDISF